MEVVYHKAFCPRLVRDYEDGETVRQKKAPRFIPGCSRSVRESPGEDFRRKPPKGLCRCKHCKHLTSNRGKVCYWCLNDLPRPRGASSAMARLARGK